MDGTTAPLPAMPASAPPLAAASDYEVVEGSDLAPAFALRSRGGFTPAPTEQRYLDQLGATLRLVCRLNETPAVAKRQEMPRDRALKGMLADAKAFAALPGGADRLAKAEAAANACLRFEGRTQEWFARVATMPFIVTAVDAAGQPIDLKTSREPVYNVELLTRDVFISGDAQGLKTSLDSALGVVKVMFAEREGRAKKAFYESDAKVAAIRARRHDYILQLYGIATVGLVHFDPTQPVFALADLARFKAEFRDREAGMVKNGYLWRLGFWCLLATIVAALCYATARGGWFGPLGVDLRNFFLLIAGAAIGTWISFSLRREVLSFEDLAVLERDQLDPSTRVLFIAGLVTVAGLLFWSRAITVGIGDFATYEAMHVHGSWAFLAGLLAGIAERALGTVVSKRADDFAGAIGGKTAA